MTPHCASAPENKVNQADYCIKATCPACPLLYFGPVKLDLHWEDKTTGCGFNQEHLRDLLSIDAVT